jgi:hypothetical protein
LARMKTRTIYYEPKRPTEIKVSYRPRHFGMTTLGDIKHSGFLLLLGLSPSIKEREALSET